MTNSCQLIKSIFNAKKGNIQMAEPIKNMYHYESILQVANDIQKVYSPFQVEDFMNSCVNENWENLELKDRMIHTATTLGEYLPHDFCDAIQIIDQVVINYGDWLTNFCAFFPFYVEIYGRDKKDWDVAMKALANYTQYSSSEFAVRWFIMNNEEKMMQQMLIWANDPSEHVRRLASEGCRPQLPWGQALTHFKEDPSLILPILETLKNDTSLFVRKSVANNLNDISKTHPEVVIKIAKKWYGKNKNTNWIVKHACRTLLKKGNKEVLSLFGFDNQDLIIRDFSLSSNEISIGNEIIFSFEIHTKESARIRLEYGVDYVKSNSKRNRKIFQISEINLSENETKKYVKKHSFENVTVRKHYPGIHSITLIINGVEKETIDFMVNSETLLP
ncbi:DNA alkylation repair protein [Anaerorhabdus sp.]|uniref:DNA alkylation repair protein n=2 Tax=Anaerorhabdus sp. TaxID=1872524 RepID=UPI002FC9CB3A